MSSAVDQMVCGIGAGVVSTLCMHPLDLLKVKFQVATAATGPAVVPAGAAGPGGAAAVATPPHPTRQQQPLGVGRQIWTTLRSIAREDGVRGLYRGLSPNIAGNAASWGLYFLLCVLEPVASSIAFADSCVGVSAIPWSSSARLVETSIPISQQRSILHLQQKPVRHLEVGLRSTHCRSHRVTQVSTRRFSQTHCGSSRLACSRPQGIRQVHIAVCLVRAFARQSQLVADDAATDGLYKLTVQEGVRGLSKGMLLALVGVSNGAIQFMTYEELKKWRANVRRRKFGSQITEEQARSLVRSL